MTDNPAHAQMDGGDRRLVALAPTGALAHRDPYAPIGHPHGAPEAQPGLSQMLFQVLNLVMKHRWLIAGAALLLATLGAAYAFLQTPLYHATVRIQIDRESSKIIKDGDVSPSDAGSADFLRTQYALLRSRSLAERVVAATRVHADPTFLKPRSVSLVGSVLSVFSSSSASLSNVQRQAASAALIHYNIVVLPVPGSRLVDITYVDPEPGRAQRIANAIADAYIDSNLDKRFQANAYAKTFLEDQSKQLKIRLEESEEALIAFSEKEKIIQVNERASNAENNLAAANVALGQIISERIKAEEQWRQVEKVKGMSLPQLLTNSVIDTLRARRNTLDTEYQEKLQTFKPSYPAMVQIANKIKEVDRQLAIEVRTIRDSLKGAFVASSNQEKEMNARIQALSDEVLDLQKRSIRHNILRREVETNRGLYNNLLQRYKEVDIAGGVGSNNVFIVDRAQRPASPSEPRHLRIILIALVLGLFLGVGVAYVIELMDDTVRAPDQVEELSGLAPLGVIPATPQSDDFIAQLNEPRSGVAEAYRSLATALQFSTTSGLPRSISVTSAGPGEGKSSTCVALSRHFAMMGLNVLLVDADLRKPSLHSKLGLDNSMGLSNYLIGSVAPPEVIQATSVPNLAFIASGPLPPNAADLLGGPRMFSLVSVGLEVFDLIVIDAPPLLGLADAPLLSNATSATLFVVGAGQSRKGAIRLALRRLHQARTNVVGCVMTKFNAKSVGYNYGYGYGYGYGDGYGYGADAFTYGGPEPANEPGTAGKPRLARSA